MAGGALLFPLYTLDDAARFFKAAAAFPAGLAERAERVLQYSNIAIEHGVQHIRNLLGRLGTSLFAKSFVAKLPPSDGMVLVAPLDTCIACSSPLVFANRTGRASQPTVYGADGILRDVQLCAKKCSKCNALHYMSYAVGVGNFGSIPDGKQRFYADATTNIWWQMSPNTIFSTKVLRQYEAQLVFSHSGALPRLNFYVLCALVTFVCAAVC